MKGIKGDVHVGPIAPVDCSVRPVDVAILYGQGQKDRAQHVAYQINPKYNPQHYDFGWEEEVWEEEAVKEFMDDFSSPDEDEEQNLEGQRVYKRPKFLSRMLGKMF